MAAILDPLNPLTDYTTVMASLNSAVRLLEFPRLYLDFHCRKYPDTRAIRTIGGILADAKFALTIDRTQFDDNLTPAWIHYRSSGEQVMRFKLDDPVVIRFMSRDGTTIPFFIESDKTIPTNPNKQSILTINITPYIRDADYTNHNVEPLS
jgi:hypothetical protein